MKNLALALFLLTITACDQPEAVEAVEFREVQAVAAKAEDIDVAHKMANSCFSYSWDYVAVTLTLHDPSLDGLQGYVLTFESNAPVDETACAWDIIEGWGQQP